MDISPDTENVLNYLEQIATNGLRKRNDLAVLFELSASEDLHEEINALIFRGTHLHNLYATLRKATPGSEGYPTLEKEFASSIEVLREHIAHVMVTAETDVVERFNNVYYAMTQGSIRNIIDLAHDLSVAKKVQNDMKYTPPDIE